MSLTGLHIVKMEMEMEIESRPRLSHYISKAKGVKDLSFSKNVRVAILSSFTIYGLEESLKVKCAERKLGCMTYSSPYNQYNQDILNSASPLYEFTPDLTFMLLDTRTILSSLFYNPYSVSVSERREYIENRVKDLVNLVRKFTIKSKSKLVVANFHTPVYSPYGICETKTEYGLREMVLDLNAKLSYSLRNEPSAFVFDFDSFVAKYGEVNVYDYRQLLFGDIKVSLNCIPSLAEEFMGYISPASGINRKCIVLDLDNTLWGGIVGEDGFEGIKLSPQYPGTSFIEFQRVIQALHERGIILAINSRNNEDEALRVIREHPYMVLRENNFASIKINWNDKISNTKAIAEELNIGLDSLVYFDDDPVNRELISIALPEVMTVDLPKDPALYAQTLMDLNIFNTFSITDEDKRRGQMYVEERKRSQLEKSVNDIDEFLSQLGIRINIRKADKFTIPRISQLVQKTNQFNLTTIRFQEEEILKFSEDKNMLVGCAQTADKFGDNGITGVFIVKKNPDYSEWNIESFLLSCRVMGRRIEYGIMEYILNEARKEGIRRVKGRYIPTSKNKPCENFLTHSGFKKDGEDWVLPLESKRE
jgi:FkbH-like protein